MYMYYILQQYKECIQVSNDLKKRQVEEGCEHLQPFYQFIIIKMRAQCYFKMESFQQCINECISITQTDQLDGRRMLWAYKKMAKCYISMNQYQQSS